jgi:N-acetylmuramoyl-L-alanine amidase
MRHPLGKIRFCLVAAALLLLVAVAAWRPCWAAPLVLIDPGHGGNERGGSLSDAVYEKDVTFAIARMVRQDLIESGRIAVQLTRTEDRRISIQERADLAARLNPRLLISLHVNAGFGNKSNGYELIFPGFGTTAPDGRAPQAAARFTAKHAYLNEGVRFAQVAARHLERVFPRKGRGLREAPIPLLEGLTVPAVVVEIGFATHPEERKRLLDPAIQKAIARALSVALSEYFR